MGLPAPIAKAPVNDAVLFLVGMDADRRWIARDSRGLLGGVFQDKAAAIRFAMFENGGRRQAVLLVPDHIRLSLTGRLPDFV